ncbi:zinc-binding dehydrogenase, partial [Paenibacillus chitinolyticus]|uniref:zinc-binding dehydrogenase n=1 Tax=Paenibacillus chitinolyticus TaxID=79263 RepID=UPI003673090B
MLTGYDAVFDTLGGEALEKSFRILKPGGQIVSISGMPNARFAKEAKLGWMKTTILSIAGRKIKTLEKKSQTRYHFLFMKPSGEQLKVLKEFIEGGLITPIMDKVYDLKEAGQAFNYLESGRAKGKVVIRIK